MGRIRFADYLKEYLEVNHISNKEFASRINITPKHLIDILSKKSELSAQIIDSISFVTGIPIDYIYRMESNFHIENEIDHYLKKEHLSEKEYLNKFDYKTLIKKTWIRFTDIYEPIEIIKDILKYLRVSSPEQLNDLESHLFVKSKNDRKELLLLWLEKCYRETLTQDVKDYTKDNILYLVRYIHEKANQNIFDEQELVKVFNENGIALVIQEDLPGSKIRGAFKVHRNMPAIYITYKHKRIADIYFALLHELAHCKSDFNKARSMSLISFEDERDIEIKADEQAFQWMVENKYYHDFVVKKEYKIDDEIKYPKSFIVYRLAHDHLLKYSSPLYQRYNRLLK